MVKTMLTDRLKPSEAHVPDSQDPLCLTTATKACGKKGGGMAAAPKGFAETVPSFFPVSGAAGGWAN